jgi:hypothetical protein
MVDKLILHPTETAQWHALLIEAQANSECQLEEDIESYLVFLLMRFSQTPSLANSVLAMDFLNSVNVPSAHKLDLLQELGDKSLLFSGLFPGLAEKKCVSVNYFIDMGKAAYYSVAELESTKGSELFEALGKNFIVMKTVLTEMQTN